MDGPDGPDQPPPPWATTGLLDHAIKTAATDVTVSTAHPDGQSPPLTLGWGNQVDVQPILVDTELDGIADKHVARYTAKYAIKGAEASGTVDEPIRYATQIPASRATQPAKGAPDGSPGQRKIGPREDHRVGTGPEGR